MPATKTNTQHTSGPWDFVPKLTASENHAGFFVRCDKLTRNGKWALALVQPGDEDGNLGEANARLIAAAPEMLAACKAALNRSVDHTTYPDGPNLDKNVRDELKAVIAKAEGKS